MRIGLFFGSFNPIHSGHLIIANQVLNLGIFDQLWFVISPQNPFKETGDLLPGKDRLFLVEKAISGDQRIRASNIEFKLPKPSYTINTLTRLQKKFPDHIFSIIMGSDSLANLDKWKNYEEIISKNEIYIYRRPGFEIADQQNQNIKILEAPLLGISATEIRRLIEEGKSIRYLVPEKVRKEIEKKGLYKK